MKIFLNEDINRYRRFDEWNIINERRFDYSFFGTF